MHQRAAGLENGYLLQTYGRGLVVTQRSINIGQLQPRLNIRIKRTNYVLQLINCFLQLMLCTKNTNLRVLKIRWAWITSANKAPNPTFLFIIARLVGLAARSSAYRVRAASYSPKTCIHMHIICGYNTLSKNICCTHLCTRSSVQGESWLWCCLETSQQWAGDTGSPGCRLRYQEHSRKRIHASPILVKDMHISVHMVHISCFKEQDLPRRRSNYWASDAHICKQCLVYEPSAASSISHTLILQRNTCLRLLWYLRFPELFEKFFQEVLLWFKPSFICSPEKRYHAGHGSRKAGKKGMDREWSRLNAEWILTLCHSTSNHSIHVL